MPTLRKKNGFTLLELIVTVAIITTTLVLGLPAFSTMIENSERKNTIYQLLGMLNFARDIAVSHSTNVVICPSTNETSCESSKSWSAKMIVFIDQNKNNTLDGNEGALRVFDYTRVNQSLSWKSFGNKSHLTYSSLGTTGFQSGRIYFCYRGGQSPKDRAQIIIYRTGRARIAHPNELKNSC